MYDKDKPATKGYGKRSLKQWAVIYLVLAVIVYAIIYLVWIRKSGSSGSGSGYGY